MWLNSLLTVFLITHISYGKDIYKVGKYNFVYVQLYVTNNGYYVTSETYISILYFILRIVHSETPETHVSFSILYKDKYIVYILVCTRQLDVNVMANVENIEF